MASLSENLKTLMSLARINASELARRTSIAQPIIHRLSTGQNISPKLATIKPIARYFLVSVSQLIGEAPLPNDQSFLSPSNHQKGWHAVPLISWEDAITWPTTLPTYQNTHGTVYVSTDANPSETAYSLRVIGSAMAPLFPNGTTLIVEPDRKPQNNDFVVAQLHNETKARFKQVVFKGEIPCLKSLNPDLGAIESPQLSNSHQLLGVMVQAKVDY